MTLHLKPGHIYRTRDFGKLSANAPRLAKRLAIKGEILRVGPGLFLYPKRTKFGPVPAKDEELIEAFLGGKDFLFSGPEHWNALRLGTTQLFADALVYNNKRSGTFALGGKKYRLRRVRFPRKPSAEWFVVDLFENGEGTDRGPEELATALTSALRQHRFEPTRLRRMAHSYGTKATRQLIDSAIAAAR